jgi:hypothetical protein
MIGAVVKQHHLLRQQKMMDGKLQPSQWLVPGAGNKTLTENLEVEEPLATQDTIRGRHPSHR